MFCIEFKKKLLSSRDPGSSIENLVLYVALSASLPLRFRYQTVVSASVDEPAIFRYSAIRLMVPWLDQSMRSIEPISQLNHCLGVNH